MTEEDKLRDIIQIAHAKQDEYMAKYENLHLLFKSEKGMNGHLKEQISILEFQPSQLSTEITALKPPFSMVELKNSKV